MTLHVSSTVVLIIRRSKLYYTASGIITLCRWPSGASVETVYQNLCWTVTVAQLNLLGCDNRFVYCLVICADFYKTVSIELGSPRIDDAISISTFCSYPIRPSYTLKILLITGGLVKGVYWDLSTVAHLLVKIEGTVTQNNYHNCIHEFRCRFLSLIICFSLNRRSRLSACAMIAIYICHYGRHEQDACHNLRTYRSPFFSCLSVTVTESSRSSYRKPPKRRAVVHFIFVVLCHEDTRLRYVRHKRESWGVAGWFLHINMWLIVMFVTNYNPKLVAFCMKFS